MRRASLDFLKELLATPSPSGFEHRVQRVWLNYAARLADETFTDTYGNAVAVLNPAGSPKVMLVGHADEIGLMVQHVDEDGFIYAAGIGGIDAGAMPGKRVVVHSRKGPVHGVVGSVAIHMQEKPAEKKAGKPHEHFIDIGARSEKLALERVAIGDPITFTEEFRILHGDVAVSRAFDNRVGTWAAAETLRLLRASRRKLNAAVFAVSGVREETGGKLAQAVARRIEADIALVTDVGQSTDTPGVDKRQYGQVAMGKGPSVAIGGPILLEVYERLMATAKRERIPVQTATAPIRSGTDADTIYSVLGGVASGLVSLPLRYMHTTAEMADLRDLEAIPKLFAAFCLGLKKGERIVARI
jgi:putative aminopeptidase FrvX